MPEIIINTPIKAIFSQQLKSYLMACSLADGAGLEPATSPGAIYQHSNQPLPTPVVPATSNLLSYPSKKKL